MLTRQTRPQLGVLQEEADHLATGVGTAWLGVGPGRAPTGPGVAGAVKDPLLEHRSPARIRLDGSGEPKAAWCLAAPQIRSSGCLSDDLITVDWVDGRVTVAMKHEHRHPSGYR